MDTTIFSMVGGKMTQVGQPNNPASANFLIVCTYGDWSGFRTLEACKSQFAELEQYEVERPGCDYRVVER